MAKPRLTRELLKLLHAMCGLIFEEIDELAALTGTSRSTAYDQVRRLRGLGLVASVPHGVGLGKPERGRKRKHQARRERFFPTSEGIKAAAADWGMDPSEYWRVLPVHPQIFRGMVPRLDALAMIYSLAALIVERTDYGSATVDHFMSVRESPHDAVLRLDGGPAIGIVRIGRRQTSTSFRNRWNAIVRDQNGWPGAVLILTATGTAWRHACAIVAARPGPPAYCAMEAQALEARRSIWGAPSDEENVISLPYIVQRLPSRGEFSPASPAPRGAARLDQYPETLPANSAASRLTPAEKDLLEVISDWHLVKRSFLPGLAGVSTVRVSQMLPSIVAQGLVKPLTLHGRTYYALSDKGLQCMSDRDRVTFRRDTWSVELTGPTGIFGGQMRALFAQLGHTDTVIRLMSDLAIETKKLAGCRLSELDPPARALIRPNHVSDRTGIEPDAGGRIRYAAADGHRWLSFVLEYERGRMTESRAVRKVELYQRLFESGHRWGPGGPPLALYVFDTPEDEREFFRVAKALDSDEPRDIRVPFALSNIEQIKSTGLLGLSWLVPEEGRETERLRLRWLNSDLRPRR